MEVLLQIYKFVLRNCVTGRDGATRAAQTLPFSIVESNPTEEATPLAARKKPLFLIIKDGVIF